MTPPPVSASRAGLVLLFLSVTGWGVNWPVTKLLMQDWPPLAGRGLTGILGGLALLAIAWARGERLAVPLPLWGPLALAAFLNITAWMAFGALSMLWLGAAEAVIIAYTMPLWAMLFAKPLLGEQLSARRLAALALGLGGLLVLTGGQTLALGIAKLPGVALTLAAAVLFALGTVRVKSHPLDLRPLPTAAWQVVGGCLPILLCGLLFESPRWSALTGAGWLAMSYTTVVAFGLCYLTWFAALRRLPAGVVALGSLLTPVIGTLAAVLLLGEALGVREFLALGLILGGLALAHRDGSAQPGGTRPPCPAD